MSFPQVLASNGDGSGVQQTTHVLKLPDGLRVGDKCIMIFNTDGISTVTWPAAWSTSLFAASYNSSGARLYIRERVIDGTEGYPATGATISVTTVDSVGSSHLSYRIARGTYGAGSSGGGSALHAGSTTPDSGSHTPAWGAADTLWMSVFGYEDGQATVTQPTNYTGEYRRWNSASGVGCAAAWRQLNATSEDPGAFTLSASKAWGATTRAFQPAADAAPTISIEQGASAQVAEAATLQLTADETGNPLPTVAWASDDEAVATVHPTTGLVTGVAVGTCTITATATNSGGSDDDSIEIEVVAAGGGGSALLVRRRMRRHR